jgi:hypothetical protein
LMATKAHLRGKGATLQPGQDGTGSTPHKFIDPARSGNLETPLSDL